MNGWVGTGKWRRKREKCEINEIRHLDNTHEAGRMAEIVMDTIRS